MAEQAWDLALAWNHIAVAGQYLTRVVSSALVAGAPPHRPPLELPPLAHHHHRELQLGFGVDDGADLELGLGGFHHRASASSSPRHGRRRRHRHSDDDDDADDEGSVSDRGADEDGSGTDRGVDEDGSGTDRGVDEVRSGTDRGEDEEGDLDDFGFSLWDLVDVAYAVGVCVPPYPIYKGTSSYRDLHSDGWSVVVFLYSLIFTALFTTFSVRVFRSSHRCLPTVLRALLLALTIFAQASATSHFLPSSALAMIVKYGSIFLHTFVYLIAWCLCCSACCRRRLRLLR